MHGLNTILARPSQLQVLRILYHASEPLTGREIERRSKLSNRAIMMALDHLVDYSAVHRESTANAHWFELNRNHYFVAKALKSAFDAEDLFWDDLRKCVRRSVHPRPRAAVATGLLARDESADCGTLDLALIFTSGRNRIRAFRSLDVLEDALWDRYALTVEVTLLDENSMDDEEYNALWKRVEREGILLFGQLE